MKLGFSIRKCADIAEDLPYQLHSFRAILPNTVAVVGIGAHCDDLTAQFFESAKVIPIRQKSAATLQSAGIDLDSLSLLDQDTKNLIYHFPVVMIENRTK